MHYATLQKQGATGSKVVVNDTTTKIGFAMPAVPVVQSKVKPVQKKGIADHLPMQAESIVQKKTTEDEELAVQGKFIAQKKELEEEPAVQGKFAVQKKISEEEEELAVQGKSVAQKKDLEDELPVQAKFTLPSNQPYNTGAAGTVQRFALNSSPLQRMPNNTGLPNSLKAGVENLSGIKMDDVKVHYNSSKPAQLQAHAFAQGTDIHIGSGQEKHLPHEAWHVVQQKQGRVKATMQMKGNVPVNDDAGLEREADIMGAQASNAGIAANPFEESHDAAQKNVQLAGIVQGNFGEKYNQIKKENYGLEPGMGIMEEMVTSGKLMKDGAKAAYNISAAPYRAAKRRAAASNSRIAKGLYYAGGATGSLLTGVTAGLGTMAASTAVGLTMGTLHGGVGLAATTVGGLVQAGASGVSSGISGARRAKKYVGTKFNHEIGVFEPTATHPLYGDMVRREPTPLDEPLSVSSSPRTAPVPVQAPVSPLAERDGTDLKAGDAPFESRFLDRGQEEEDLFASPASEPLAADRDLSRPLGAGLGFGPELAPRADLNNFFAPRKGADLFDGDVPRSRLMESGMRFETPRKRDQADLFATEKEDIFGGYLPPSRSMQLGLGTGKAKPRDPNNLFAEETESLFAEPAASPSSALLPPEPPSRFNVDGSAKNYNKIGGYETGKYGLVTSSVLSSASGGSASLVGKATDLPVIGPLINDDSLKAATDSSVQGFGVASGILGTGVALVDAYEGMKGMTDSGRDKDSRLLSGGQVGTSLAAATKGSASAAMNIGHLTGASHAVMAGAEMAAGGAAIATGGIDMVRGVYANRVAAKRIEKMEELAGSLTDGRVKKAAAIAIESQKRIKATAAVTAARGGLSVIGGVLIVASLTTTPIGWMVLSGAAAIGGIAALITYIKKRDSKKRIAIREFGIEQKRASWKSKFKEAESISRFKRTERNKAIKDCGPDPLQEKLDEYHFHNVSHFYANYMNYTSHYLYNHGVVGSDNDAKELLSGMGLKVDPRKGEPTAETIGKQLSI